MNTLEIWLLAISLAMDCFTVSITSGIIMRRICRRTFFVMAFFFGLFQAVMPLIGWFCASRFSHLIKDYDHWIAFGLLAFLGMPIEAVVMIMSFIAVRKFSGGYHADSFYKCLIISSIVIMTMLQISTYINNNLLFNVIYIASSILLMIFSPIDSANKRLDNDDKRFCKKITILIVVVLFIIVELQWIAGYRYYTKFIESGVMLAEILQLLAIFNLKYDRK